MYKVPGFPLSEIQEEASVYLMEQQVWSAEAVSKGSYRTVKRDSADALQKHSAVKNALCLKSMTAFRDLVGTQVFSFTPLTHKDECVHVCECVFEGDKKSHFSCF